MCATSVPYPLNDVRTPWRVGRRRRVVAGNRHSTETVGAGSVWRGSAQELRLQNQVFN
jgi:hypothetical protein